MQTNNQLPPNAELKFKGVIFDIYQWKQKMFDGSTKTFERLKRPNSVVIIPVVGNKILIQEQEQPGRPVFPSLPGGRCDEGEEPLESAKREFLEETGYISNNWELWNTTKPYNKMVWTIYRFIVRDCVFKQNPVLDAGEKITTKLISFDEFVMFSENEKFRDKELIITLLKLRLHPEKQEEFKKLLFKS